MSDKLPYMTTSRRGENEWGLHLDLDLVAVEQTEDSPPCAGCVFFEDDSLAPLCTHAGGAEDLGRPDCVFAARVDGRSIVWKHRADVEPAPEAAPTKRRRP